MCVRTSVCTRALTHTHSGKEGGRKEQREGGTDGWREETNLPEIPRNILYFYLTKGSYPTQNYKKGGLEM